MSLYSHKVGVPSAFHPPHQPEKTSGGPAPKGKKALQNVGNHEDIARKSTLNCRHRSCRHWQFAMNQGCWASTPPPPPNPKHRQFTGNSRCFGCRTPTRPGVPNPKHRQFTANCGCFWFRTPTPPRGSEPQTSGVHGELRMFLVPNPNPPGVPNPKHPEFTVNC